MSEEENRGYDGRLCWQSRSACNGADCEGIYEAVLQAKPKEDRDRGGHPAAILVLLLASIRGPADRFEIVRWLRARERAGHLL